MLPPIVRGKDYNTPKQCHWSLRLLSCSEKSGILSAMSTLWSNVMLRFLTLDSSSTFTHWFFLSPFANTCFSSFPLTPPPFSSSCCDLPGDSWWIRESERHRAWTPSRPVNMHANVALDISTMEHASWWRAECGWVFKRVCGVGWVRDGTERERTEIRTDSVMPV